jgi:hypothetical protein
VRDHFGFGCEGDVRECVSLQIVINTGIKHWLLCTKYSTGASHTTLNLLVCVGIRADELIYLVMSIFVSVDKNGKGMMLTHPSTTTTYLPTSIYTNQCFGFCTEIPWDQSQF